MGRLSPERNMAPSAWSQCNSSSSGGVVMRSPPQDNNNPDQIVAARRRIKINTESEHQDSDLEFGVNSIRLILQEELASVKATWAQGLEEVDQEQLAQQREWMKKFFIEERDGLKPDVLFLGEPEASQKMDNLPSSSAWAEEDVSAIPALPQKASSHSSFASVASSNHCVVFPVVNPGPSWQFDPENEPATRRSVRRLTGRSSQTSNTDDTVKRGDHQDWRRHRQRVLSAQLSSLNHGSASGTLVRTFNSFGGFCGFLSVSRSSSGSGNRKSKLARIVESDGFNLCSGFVILINAIFIGVETEIRAKNAFNDSRGLPTKEPIWFELCDWFFLSLFFLEVLIRLIALRWEFVVGPGWSWNIFDCGLLVYSVIDEILEGYNLTYARVLRSFRMVRVLRAIRATPCFRELRYMVCAIIQSLASLFWALVLLVLIIYLFTICFINATVHELQQGDPSRDLVEQLKSYYSSVGETMFCLLMAITGGVDWQELVDPLGEISYVYRIIFAIYIVFVLIGVLNVLTSHFVERAREIGKLDRDIKVQSELQQHDTLVAELRGMFEEVDKDGTGEITWQKFKEYLVHEDVQAYFAAHQIDTSDARELFNLLCVSDSEKVALEEFIMGCMKLKGQAKSADVATLLRESRRTGQRTKSILRRVEQQLNHLCCTMHGLHGR